jgi:NAD(P)-dependent dehydrogenase (short-subunit alcohol dehydrogenase family)
VVFVNGVLPLLKKAASYPGADVRIILTGSNAHHMMVPAKFPLDFSTPSVFQGKLPYTPLLSQVQQRLLFNMNMLHYGVAKVAVSLFARELQAVMDAQRLPILVVSTHPGGVRSDDVHTVFKPWLWPLISGTFIPVDQGTVVSLFMATDPAVRRKPEAYKGQYVEPTGVHPGHPILRDAAQQRALWNATESELNRCLTKKGHSPLLAW